jgi:hypothetical protein
MGDFFSHRIVAFERQCQNRYLDLKFINYGMNDKYFI